MRCRVLRVYKRIAYHLQVLTLRDEFGVEQSHRVTDEHPYHLLPGGWMPARTLQVGDVVRGEAGVLEVLANLGEDHPESIEVYNFEVEQAHTYFVLAEHAPADADAVWVHNANNYTNLDADDVNSDTVRRWADQFESRPAQGSGEWHEFQVDVAGPRETRIAGGGEEIWADGINFDEALIREAKFASNPFNSPVIASSSAAPVAKAQYQARLDAQLEQYAAIIHDRNNPIRGLQMITNNIEAAALLFDRMSAAGIRGRVDVVQFGRFSELGSAV